MAQMFEAILAYSLCALLGVIIAMAAVGAKKFLDDDIKKHK